MFSLFQKQSDKSPNRNIFDEADIHQILQSFTLDSKTPISTKEPKLFLSTSGTTLVQAAGIRKSLESWISQERGRKPVSEFATLAAVDPKTILDVLADINSVVTVDKKLIVSNDEQERIVTRLKSLASDKFVDEADFCSNEELSSVSLAALISRYDNGKELISFRRPSEARPSDSKSFIISKRLHEAIRKDLVSQIASAEEQAPSKGPQLGGAEVMLDSITFLGLPVEDALCLSGSFKAETSSIEGEFKVEGGRIFYVPKSYVSALRSQLFSDLKSGSIPFLDARKLVDELPGEFDNEKAALDAIMASSDTSNAVHIVGDYAISNAWIKARGDDVQRTLDANKPVNPQQYRRPIPSRHQDEVWDLIIGSLSSFAPYKTLGNYRGYVVSKQWIHSIETRAEAFAKELAEHAWLSEEYQKSKPATITAKIREDLQISLSKDGVEEDVIESYIESDRKELDSVILGTYNTVTNQLEIVCDDQFKKLWMTRVVESTRLYSAALQAMDDSPLKSQLEMLLRAHIVSEVVPTTANKAKTRKLLRSPHLKLSSRLPKLQSTLSSNLKKELQSVIEELEKFNEKIGIQTYEESTLHQKKKEYLSNLTESMAKDEDSVRLFICLLIILYSSASSGVLYATGKFAPKLLKFLKASLDTEQALWLEQVKDAIKAGSITEEMKHTMRSMASKAANDSS